MYASFVIEHIDMVEFCHLKNPFQKFFVAQNCIEKGLEIYFLSLLKKANTILRSIF